MNKQLVLDAVEKFKEKRVLVIGDAILDVTEHCSSIGRSLETPTPKYAHEETEISYGGAGNVVENILALGGKVSFITLLGKDDWSKHYRSIHDNLKFIPVVEEGRKTTVKQRFWDGNGKKVFQYDYLDNRDLGGWSQDRVLGFAVQEAMESDVVLLVDYRHGMFPKELIGKLKDKIGELGKPIIASSQISQRESNHLDYAGVDLVCVNMKEARAIDPEFSLDSLEGLERKLDSGILLTLGALGSAVYFDGEDYRVGGIKVEERDAVGAGDCYLAAFSLAGHKADPETALYLGNIWGGLSVREIGTNTPKLNELVKYVEENN